MDGPENIQTVRDEKYEEGEGFEWQKSLQA